MANHVPPPLSYDGDWQRSPITETDRHQFETAVRQLQRGHLDDCRLRLDAYPLVTEITLSYADVDGGFSLDVYIAENAIDATIVASEHFDEQESVTFNDDPHLLRDLGRYWYQLETDLISLLVTTLGLPTATDDLARYTVTPIGLRCTTAQTGSLTCFASLFFDSSYSLSTELD